MRTFEEMEKAVLNYCERHGHKPKYTECFPKDMYIRIEAFDFATIEAKATRKKTTFKVDGKVTSIKK